MCIFPDRLIQNGVGWGGVRAGMAPRGAEMLSSVFRRTEQWGFDPGPRGKALRPRNAVKASQRTDMGSILAANRGAGVAGTLTLQLCSHGMHMSSLNYTLG